MTRQEQKVKQFYTDAFDKMFQMVGYEKADQELIGKPQWYTTHTWSLDNEKAFAAWFIAEYKKRFRSKKAYAEQECRWFLFDFGWSLDLSKKE